MATRSKASLKVVSKPAVHAGYCARSMCSIHAESLPLDQLTTIFITSILVPVQAPACRLMISSADSRSQRAFYKTARRSGGQECFLAKEKSPDLLSLLLMLLRQAAGVRIDHPPMIRCESPNSCHR